MRCFNDLYVYHVKAHFVQGFTRIKALANYCHPTVRWGGLWENIKSGMKFLFKIKLLVAIGYAPLAKGLRHSVRFRQKTRGMALCGLFFYYGIANYFLFTTPCGVFRSACCSREYGQVVLRPSVAELRRCGMDAAVS